MLFNSCQPLTLRFLDWQLYAPAYLDSDPLLQPKAQISLKTRPCINRSDQEFGRFRQTSGLIGELVGFT